MTAAIIQSNYIPWRGYFDFIDSVDLFILYDDVVYGTGAKWRNRNLIKTHNGIQWLTVPILHEDRQLNIEQVKICYARNWIRKHIRTLEYTYGNAPHFNLYFNKYTDILLEKNVFLSQLNCNLIIWIARELGITTKIIQSSTLRLPAQSKYDRVISILKETGASAYLTGPNTISYTNIAAFQRHKIALYVKRYKYKVYPQLGREFVDHLTVLDLLFNVGPSSRTYLKSTEQSTALS